MNFNLKDKHAEITALYASISAPTRWKYFIGLSVSPKVWDQGKQRVKPQHPNRIQINRLLDKVEKEVYDIWLESMNQGRNLTKAAIKTRLDIALGKQEDTSNQLIPFIEQFISERMAHPEYKSNTIQNYRTALWKLKALDEKTTFDDVDMTYFYKLVYLMNEEGMKQNSQASLIKNLKVFMNDALARGYTTNKKFKNKKFHIASVDPDNIFLNEDQLDHLYRFKFNDKLSRVRDLFLVMAWTGVRYSDLHKVKWENVEGDYLTIKMQKTRKTVSIPLHPAVVNILNEHEALPVISNVKLNKYLKEMGAEANIENYNEITTHTGRRSMISNLHLAGYPDSTIMEISGHAKHKDLRRYLSGIAKTDHSKVLSRFWRNKKGYLRAI